MKEPLYFDWAFMLILTNDEIKMPELDSGCKNLIIKLNKNA